MGRDEKCLWERQTGVHFWEWLGDSKALGNSHWKEGTGKAFEGGEAAVILLAVATSLIRGSFTAQGLG